MRQRWAVGVGRPTAGRKPQAVAQRRLEVPFRGPWSPVRHYVPEGAAVLNALSGAKGTCMTRTLFS